MVFSISEDLTDLPAPVGTEEGCSSDEEEFYDADHEGALTSEDISAIYSDWINEMKRIDKQKMTMLLYDNYVGNTKDTSCKGSRIVLQREWQDS